MGRKYEVWLDSGANAFSSYTQEIDVEEDLGMTIEKWDSLSEQEKEETMKEIAWERMEWGIAWERMEWGFSEIEEE